MGVKKNINYEYKRTKKIQPQKNNRVGKRREVNQKECSYDLRKDFPKLFKAYNIALKQFNNTFGIIRPSARVRLDAALFNSFMIQAIQDEFPHGWKFGKYKRFVLKVEDYLFLFKKLNSKGLPMNISTKEVNSISSQLQISLFENEEFFTEPILFFGYQKNKTGELINPQIVYIDEDKIKWVITSDNISQDNSNIATLNGLKSGNVTVKEELVRKKASNQ